MFNIIHGTVEQNEENRNGIEWFENILKVWNEKFQDGLEWSQTYEQRLRQNLVRLSTQGKTKGNPISQDTDLQDRVEKTSIISKKESSINHSVFRDIRKIYRRGNKNNNDVFTIYGEKNLKFQGKKNKKLISVNELFDVIEFNSSLSYIKVSPKGDSNVVFSIKLHNLYKHPNFDPNKGLGVRIKKRNNKNAKKWKDKYHILLDYDDGLEREEVFQDYDFYIGFDTNDKHLDLTVLDRQGNIVRYKTFPFQNRVSAVYEELTRQLSETVKRAVRFCKKKFPNSVIILENLADGQVNKSGNGIGGKGGYSKQLSRFPRKKVESAFIRRCIKEEIQYYFVNSRFTSRAAQKYIHKDYPLNVSYKDFFKEPHAAAYHIALKGKFFIENKVLDKEQIEKEIKSIEKEKRRSWSKSQRNREKRFTRNFIRNIAPAQISITQKSILFSVEETRKVIISLFKNAKNIKKDGYDLYRILWSGKGKLTPKVKEILEEQTIDLTKIVEIGDNTNLTGEAACAGGKCEII